MNIRKNNQNYQIIMDSVIINSVCVFDACRIFCVCLSLYLYVSAFVCMYLWVCVSMCACRILSVIDSSERNFLSKVQTFLSIHTFFFLNPLILIRFRLWSTERNCFMVIFYFFYLESVKKYLCAVVIHLLRLSQTSLIRARIDHLSFFFKSAIWNFGISHFWFIFSFSVSISFLNKLQDLWSLRLTKPNLPGISASAFSFSLIHC